MNLAEMVTARRTADRVRATPYDRARGVELRYVSQLRKVARIIGELIDGMGDPLTDPGAMPRIDEAMRRYSEILTPWAASAGARMVAEVEAQDARSWHRMSQEMGRTLRQEIARAPTGLAMQESMARQVVLIKSLPLDASARVHKLATEALINSTRAAEVAKDIARSGQVSKSRATLIARTEVARAKTELTKARAEHVGSDGYIWRTSRDSDVRPSHRFMEGKVVNWNAPPTLDGLTGHAGCLPNCRCTVEVIIPAY